MRGETLQIAEDAATEAEEAYADDRDLELGDRRLQGGGGDEERCGTHQPDAAGDGGNPEGGRRRHLTGEGPDQPEQPQQLSHPPPPYEWTNRR